MPWYERSRRLLTWLALISCVFFLGCGSMANLPETAPPNRFDIDTILVLGFEPPKQGVGLDTDVRCPICGAIFEGGAVETDTAEYMTKQSLAYLRGETSYTLIPPDMAEGVRSRIVWEDVSVPLRRLIVEMGKRVGADAVLYGAIYRFGQRVGTALSVESPASVGFGIHLIRVADGRSIWRGRFDETQQSLSEDLFKLGVFLKRGGGWLTAEELAMFGLHQVMASFPVSKKLPEAKTIGE